MKRLMLPVLLFLFVILARPALATSDVALAKSDLAFAESNTFVSIVNPVRGDDFWQVKDQKPETAVLGQIAILNKFNLPATFLLRFDVLGNRTVINSLKNSGFEKGLFLEVTPSWTVQGGVSYHKSGSWHSAGSAFLTGYEPVVREKLIDTAFAKFKSIFGYYPASVGAWWIDSYSLGYMQKKYGVTLALIVSDQYSTDNYQIWGQYFGTPYYPSKNNALHPAQTLENKLDVVITQWAARDPVNGYGNGVEESTFSLQSNDYIDYHNLDTNYFSSLIDIYTKQRFNQFAQIVVGLENSYEWSKYADEYQKQMALLTEKKTINKLSALTLKDFASWYKSTFPKLSPEQFIVADDLLGSFKKTVWFMNPYYRVGWFLNDDGSVLRDIRQYIDGKEELCFKSRCDSVNFATSATRVLDDVSFGHRWVIDQGKITDFKAEREGEEFVISYKNEAGNLRQIGFLPRDIKIDEKVFSIDTAILDATKKGNEVIKDMVAPESFLQWSLSSVALKLGKFLAFLMFAIVLPGFIFSNQIFSRNTPLFLRLFLSSVIGFVLLTLLFYITSLLKIRPLIFVYALISFIAFLHFNPPSVILRSLRRPQNDRVEWFNLMLVVIILAGTIFQVVPTFRSGLTYGYGMGFWGPNTHDGVWHIALINQLAKSVPAQNPIFSGTILKNYHFFYDLLVASTNYFTAIPASDLIFRFYPILFSMMLGIGSYYLIVKFFKNKMAGFLSLYLIYFAGSFGWIVEFLRERHFGGESAFWASQSVSFNLNPPFAVSLIIIIAFLHILFEGNIFLGILLAGSLVGFKSYGAVLVSAAILFVGLVKKQLQYLIIFSGALLIAILIFVLNFDTGTNLLVFAPFWFIHSMIDSPDRVGWVRLSLAREAGLATGNWFKYILSEIISFIIFIAGNLGLRVVSLLSLIKIKSIVKDEKLLYIFIFALLSFLIPIFFIQSGNPWNTIQFFYYGLYIASIGSGAVLSLAVFRLPKYFAVLTVLLVVILAPINSVVTAGGYLSNRPHAFVSSKELSALQFLSGQEDGIVLTYPYDEKLKQKLPEPWPILAYDSTAYVSAFSKKAVYLEDEPQNQILLTDDKKRLVASADFFLKPDSKFLKDNNISYIYLLKIYNLQLDESIDVVKNIFENDEVLIYRTYGI